MLNISNNSVNDEVNLGMFKSGKFVSDKKYYKSFKRVFTLSLILVMIVMFVPWTQNVTGTGYITTLKPNQRPQTIQSPIPGRIEEWFVKEGDFVKKGDTILRIAEVKSEYFDDKLVERTEIQIQSKNQSKDAYAQKSNALQNQILALKSEQALKIEQAKNKLQQAYLKVKSNEIDLEAARTNQSIAETQYGRVISLESDGLKATKDVEEKRLKLQEAKAKFISQENKLLESKNEVANAELELSRIKASYADKTSKAESDLYSAQSNQYTTEAEVAKLENSYSNYEKRKSLLYVTSPQDGYINKAVLGGLGVTFKEGESLVKIMPANYELAVETYVRPIDMPLIHIGEKVRVQFDGWPAIVFSGWESISYGTYGAKVVAVETFISENGMYRVLLAPDQKDNKWPGGLRVGSGAKTIALLEDVPIWYELWRKINGFPPNFYTPVNSNSKDGKKNS